MQQKRISIAINLNIKEQLEKLAKTNYRTLNGEINKALDFYIMSHSTGELEQKDLFTTPTHVIETPSVTHTEALLEPIEPTTQTYSHANQYDEVEEF